MISRSFISRQSLQQNLSHLQKQNPSFPEAVSGRSGKNRNIFAAGPSSKADSTRFPSAALQLPNIQLFPLKAPFIWKDAVRSCRSPERPSAERPPEEGRILLGGGERFYLLIRKETDHDFEMLGAGEKIEGADKINPPAGFQKPGEVPNQRVGVTGKINQSLKGLGGF